ncbi:proline-rich receptor-like protein kinase PERK9 [Iris pallida]|nr:proline-rich receptor-like protein kinase PERK9 [Iris pallida]
MSSQRLTWESSSSSSAAAADRLSSLDRNLLLHILTFLPYKSAVATSLLSSAWRDLWLHRWSHPHSHLRLSSSHDVDRFLYLLRPLPLRLDSLHLSSPSSSADRLLRLAADLQLQDLSLEAPAFADSPDLIPLPPSLVRLTLYSLRIPIRFSSPLASLQTLNLHSVSISDEALADVVSSAYLLKTLELRRCRGLHHVRIPGDGLWLENVVVAECCGISRIRIQTRR